MNTNEIQKYIESKFAGNNKVYSLSLHTMNECTAFIYDDGDKDLIIASDGCGFDGEAIVADNKKWIIAEENHKNACALRKLFPFTAPVPILRNKRTFGVGDRLGIATPGHIRVFEKYDAYPIFAQQSIRELKLTNRTFEDVLDKATFAVFRDNYTKGFGADGDHLKTFDEVRYALSCGYTMITLDCSEHIRNDIVSMSDREVENEYQADVTKEAKYINNVFEIGGERIIIDKPQFMRMSLIYDDAIDFAVSIYDAFFKGNENKLDFEISIDETMTPTKPAQHFYVASELYARGVRPQTIAPRFCGEFQKGIDYIGNINQFNRELKQHVAIANHFGYKLSVHSGSDKFSVFESIGKFTHGEFHVKTAGTNWLEAMKIVAEYNPKLYREIHKYALNYAFDEASNYYHVTTDLSKIPNVDSLSDTELPRLFENNDARQLIHITYGLILNKKDENGQYCFRNKLYRLWRCHRKEYADALEKHIGHHMELLYSFHD